MSTKAGPMGLLVPPPRRGAPLFRTGTSSCPPRRPPCPRCSACAELRRAGLQADVLRALALPGHVVAPLLARAPRLCVWRRVQPRRKNAPLGEPLVDRSERALDRRAAPTPSHSLTPPPLAPPTPSPTPPPTAWNTLLLRPCASQSRETQGIPRRARHDVFGGARDLGREDARRPHLPLPGRFREAPTGGETLSKADIGVVRQRREVRRRGRPKFRTEAGAQDRIGTNPGVAHVLHWPCTTTILVLHCFCVCIVYVAYPQNADAAIVLPWRVSYLCTISAVPVRCRDSTSATPVRRGARGQGATAGASDARDLGQAGRGGGTAAAVHRGRAVARRSGFRTATRRVSP